MSKRVIVIGGGIGGLATALRLPGHVSVTLLENHPPTHSGADPWQISYSRSTGDQPFRFDLPAGVLTMPFVFLDLFAAAGADVRDHLRIHRLDPLERYHWADGTTHDLRSEEAHRKAQVAKQSPGDIDGWIRLLARGRRAWELNELAEAPRGSVRTLFRRWRAGDFLSFERFVAQHIHDPRLRQVCRRCKSQPEADVPLSLAADLWLEHHYGAWWIEGGLRKLMDELRGLARGRGIDVRGEVQCASIIVESGRAVGVRLRDETELRADAVVVEPSGSSNDEGPMLQLGIEGTFPQLAGRNVLVSKGDEIRVGSAIGIDPAAAPAGFDALTIGMAAEQDRGQLISELEKQWGLHELSRRIVIERTITPATRVELPDNAGSRPVERLYRGRADGAAIHGLARSVLSAKRVSGQVLQDLAC